MSEPDLQPASRKRFHLLKYGRRLVLLGIIVLSVPLLALGIARHIGFQQLREAIEEADRLDPGWRMHELEAKRADVPENENSALLVQEAAAFIPKSWPTDPDELEAGDPKHEHPGYITLELALKEVPPEALLPSELLRDLRKEIGSVAPALAVARRLENAPRGRYAPYITENFIGTRWPNLEEVQRVKDLLWFHAYLQGQDQNTDAALACCRCIINVGRSIGDDPFPFTQLVRPNCQTSATSILQRVLAQGQPSVEALATTQYFLEEEITYPSVLIFLRGERAWLSGLMERVESGKLEFSVMKMSSRQETPKTFLILDIISNWFSSSPSTNSPSNNSLPPDKYDYNFHLIPSLLHARNLKHLNHCIEIAKLPIEEQLHSFEQLEAKLPPSLSYRDDLFRWSIIAKSARIHQIEMRCAIAALAAERYRIRHGQWPASLTELVAGKLLSTVLIDPFDSKPLRFRRLSDGIVIYSIGPEGVDNGGKLVSFRDLEKSGSNLGFRLWDVSKRRQPPPPPKPRDEPLEHDAP